MELNEIVETKFLPPESTWESQDIDADFGVDVEGEDYIPWIRHISGDCRGNNVKFFIKADAKSGNRADRFKVRFKTIECARKHIWNFFRDKTLLSHYKPKKAIQNETK